MLLDRRRVKFWQRIVFGGLAVIFAAGFVIGGVGTGSNFSISDIFGNGNGGGSSSTTAGSGQISTLEKQVKATPRNEQAWVSLGQAYEAAQRPQDAIGAYEHAVKLDPRDADTLQTLAGLYQAQGNTLASEAQTAQQQAYAVQQNQPGTSLFTPGSSGALGSALQSPIDQARQSQVSQASSQLQTEASSLYGQAQTWYQKALQPYGKLVALHPKDPRLWIQYGLVARSANDVPTAVHALRKFLVLAPDDPEAGSVKQLIKQLKSSSSSSAATGG